MWCRVGPPPPTRRFWVLFHQSPPSRRAKKTPSVDFPSCTKQLFKCLISCGCFRCLALPFFFTMGYSTFTSDVRAIPLVALVRILPVSQIWTLWPSFVVFFSALKTITLISLHLLTSPIDVYRKWTLLELILLLCSLSPHLVKRDPCWPVSSYLHWLPCILIRISEFYQTSICSFGFYPDRLFRMLQAKKAASYFAPASTLICYSYACLYLAASRLSGCCRLDIFYARLFLSAVFFYKLQAFRRVCTWW